MTSPRIRHPVLPRRGQQPGGRQTASGLSQVSRMPFGKYKGTPLSAVPDDYLLWLAAREDLRDPLCSAIAHELQTRGHSCALPSLAVRLQQAQESGFFLVSAGKEEEAGTYHAWCTATGTPSICVALDGRTATIAITFFSGLLPQTGVHTILQGLAERWSAYHPQYLPPCSFVLLGVPRDIVEEAALSVSALARSVCP
jgi:hypothetical protein